jgi:hypothetical protein
MGKVCAFEGSTLILRLYGRGRTVRPDDRDWAALAPHFPPARTGVCQVIVAELTRVQTSCGFGVPEYAFDAERDGLVRWAEETGPDGLAAYQREKNTTSIDGLPTPMTAGRGPA